MVAGVRTKLGKTGVEEEEGEVVCETNRLRAKVDVLPLICRFHPPEQRDGRTFHSETV